MRNGLGVKIQTRRATNYRDGILSANLSFGEFSLSICTTKYWGNYEPVEEPTIEIETGKRTIIIGMAKFCRMIEEVK
jgi:hypothetical protein